jgi:D-alanyl-lipoteichoic acid acyltransferase DltB (MBOAT superfamily)
MCLGFAVRDNFHFPYAAIGFSHFWRRWHISLSTWLRDYLYVSLGGNRKGTTRTYINLALTMLIGGLWHGAAWRFVVWGGLHGAYLIGERLIKQLFGERDGEARRQAKVVRDFNPAVARGSSAGAVAIAEQIEVAPSIAKQTTWMGPVLMALVTYVLVCVTWVFFRASDFNSAIQVLRAMVVPSLGSGLGLGWYEMGSVSLITVAMLMMHWRLRDSSIEGAVSMWPQWKRIAVLTFLLIAIALAPGDERAFIYFQF